MILQDRVQCAICKKPPELIQSDYDSQTNVFKYKVFCHGQVAVIPYVKGQLSLAFKPLSQVIPRLNGNYLAPVFQQKSEKEAPNQNGARMTPPNLGI